SRSTARRRPRRRPCSASGSRTELRARLDEPPLRAPREAGCPPWVVLGVKVGGIRSFGVTTNPTAEWISRQIIEAFPWDSSPHYLIRDRGTAYGVVFRQRLRAMGIRDKPTAPRSPWQNPYVERLIGTIRRECLDHMIVFGEAHLRRILGRYAAYYNESRIH